MKTLAKNVCILSFVLLTGSVFAQNVLDGAYVDENSPNRRVIPYTFLRQADVMWQKRIWRIIDLREKMNLPLFYPLQANANRKSVFEVMRNALKSGEITGYDFSLDWDNSFVLPLTKTEVEDKLSKTDTLQDENGNPKVVHEDVTNDKIKQYMLKEDWFFDKQRSVMDVRTLGICPMKATVNSNTGEEDASGASTPIFWIYYPSVRSLFAITEVFNVENDAERRTLEDIFWKRQFSSYIVQESNVYNRSIAGYLVGLDTQLENEKIKKKMFDLEHDMWQY
ncbi:MAG TPA: gliding motility protein GldN [Bacteroidia bacterium]|jgi:gliding motility associated protien GldN|nr:gliding motility protein GldN [Bacteroidia bacterium]